MRSLLSEGEINYQTTEKTKDGFRPRLVHRDGPAGFLTTTTSVSLHPENETRMLSIPTTDTPDQTARILLATALDVKHGDIPPSWHAFQWWLALANHEVVIPCADTLARMIPPMAIRLRRDFPTLLSLIKTHAILHQASRERNEQGYIVATIDDYRAVYELVADLMSAGTEATVPKTVRQTVQAASALISGGGAEALGDPTLEVFGPTAVSITKIAGHLKLDKSTASRRVSVAIDGGYLKKREDQRGISAGIMLGEPLPEDQTLLPSPEDLAKCCSVAVNSQGFPHSPNDHRAADPDVTAPTNVESPSPDKVLGQDIGTKPMF